MCREEAGDEEEPHAVTSVLPEGLGTWGAPLAEVAAPAMKVAAEPGPLPAHCR